jgi:hypothetical protein
VVRRIIRNLVVLAALACAVAARASDDVPRFLIERIEVRNLRHASREIVVAESRLREGATYDERELAAASDRINRLPFILDAAFSLEKGSVRNAYVLAITVSETKPFFYLLDGPFVLEREGANVDYQSQSAVGYRVFTGRRNAFHAGFTADGGEHKPGGRQPATVEAGYTRYDLFGTGAFATFNLKSTVVETSRDKRGRILPELTVGIPLSATKTVTLQYTQSQRTFESPGESLESPGTLAEEPFERERLFTARWAYNTTNAPFFPTRGVILSGGPEVRWSDNLHYFDLDFEPAGTIHLPIRERGHSVSFGLQAGRYWEVSERNSLSVLASGELEARNSKVSFGELSDETQKTSDHNQYGRIDLGFSHSFWSPERIAVDGDQRIEVHLRAFLDRFENPHTAEGPFLTDRISGEQLSVSWVRRNAWGAIRIGLGYAW